IHESISSPCCCTCHVKKQLFSCQSPQAYKEPGMARQQNGTIAVRRSQRTPMFKTQTYLCEFPILNRSAFDLFYLSRNYRMCINGCCIQFCNFNGRLQIPFVGGDLM